MKVQATGASKTLHQKLWVDPFEVAIIWWLRRENYRTGVFITIWRKQRTKASLALLWIAQLVISLQSTLMPLPLSPCFGNEKNWMLRQAPRACIHWLNQQLKLHFSMHEACRCKRKQKKYRIIIKVELWYWIHASMSPIIRTVDHLSNKRKFSVVLVSFGMKKEELTGFRETHRYENKVTFATLPLQLATGGYDGRYKDIMACF